MRRSGLTAVSAGLVFAVCVPAWARSEASSDKGGDKGVSGRCQHRQVGQKRSHAQAAPAKSAPATARIASDTIVVPDGGPGRPGYTMVGENVTYDDPKFVPYKLTEAARRARASVDISKIP
jgi:hypothetical protein